MPLFDSENDGSSSSSDEEANAAMRAEIARKNKEEREKMIKRRREAEAREEEQRFKLEKISDLTLQEVLERKALLIGPEDKNDFKTFIPKVVAHFQKEEKDESFNQRMREITSIIGLTNFIVERHSALLSEPAGDVEAFLKKFQKEIVESLGEMTKILPKEEYLKLATLGNVFVDSREKLMKKEAMKRNMDDFMERARLVRIQEEQEEELAMDELTNIFAQTNISFDASVTREMAVTIDE
uniref:Uncharacterized protein n=1 Tax=Caenorhabditis japonica TaxID=281687 RepID=A0A8R1DSV4_CAEJA